MTFPFASIVHPFSGVVYTRVLSCLSSGGKTLCTGPTGAASVLQGASPRGNRRRGANRHTLDLPASRGWQLRFWPGESRIPTGRGPGPFLHVGFLQGQERWHRLIYAK